MIRACALAAGASLAALTGINAWAADPLPTETHKVLTVEVALEAAQAAIAACKSQGYNITVTVADRMGNPKVVIVRDGPPGVGQESTRRKAYTAARQRVSTAEFTNRISRPGAFNPAQFDRELATGAGGVPAASRLPALRAATRTKPVRRPASTRSRTGSGKRSKAGRVGKGATRCSACCHSPSIDGRKRP